jgi:integrase/recombinase XerD
MPKKGWRKTPVGDIDDPDGILAWTWRYLEHIEVRGDAKQTVHTTRGCLYMFAEWAHHRGIDRVFDVDRAVVEGYQRSLFYGTKRSGEPLTLSSQRVRLQKVRNLFRFLARKGVLPSNPAAEVDLPKLERRLPRNVLNQKEVEQVLALPDLSTRAGLRDRAIMEVLYSTGLRRFELAGLKLGDIDEERGIVIVRLGKGKKDRVVPIGGRAVMWVHRYLDEVRPHLMTPPGHNVLFVTIAGEPFPVARMTHRLTQYFERTDFGKTGACHIFRHTMATLMLEGGADVRVIQEILGHAELSTTEIYTRVSIKHLKKVHARTHPGANLDGEGPSTADAEDGVEGVGGQDPGAESE